MCRRTDAGRGRTAPAPGAPGAPGAGGGDEGTPHDRPKAAMACISGRLPEPFSRERVEGGEGNACCCDGRGASRPWARIHARTVVMPSGASPRTSAANDTSGACPCAADPSLPSLPSLPRGARSDGASDRNPPAPPPPARGGSGERGGARKPWPCDMARAWPSGADTERCLRRPRSVGDDAMAGEYAPVPPSEARPRRPNAACVDGERAIASAMPGPDSVRCRGCWMGASAPGEWRCAEGEMRRPAPRCASAASARSCSSASFRMSTGVGLRDLVGDGDSHPSSWFALPRRPDARRGVDAPPAYSQSEGVPLILAPSEDSRRPRSGGGSSGLRSARPFARICCDLVPCDACGWRPPHPRLTSFRRTAPLGGAGL